MHPKRKELISGPNKKLTVPSALQGESGRKIHIKPKKSQNSFRKSGVYVSSRVDPILEVWEENTSATVIPTDVRSNLFPFVKGSDGWLCLCLPSASSERVEKDQP